MSSPNADKVTVIFQDDSKHPAKVIGRDTKTDLALLKIETDKPLPYVTWGDSNAAQVGDWVLAVGNPFGLGGTVSSGIISARGRDIHSGPYDDFLQIDAVDQPRQFRRPDLQSRRPGRSASTPRSIRPMAARSASASPFRRAWPSP